MNLAQTDIKIECQLNKNLSMAIDEAFNTNNGKDFAEMVNKILPTIIKKRPISYGWLRI